MASKEQPQDVDPSSTSQSAGAEEHGQWQDRLLDTKATTTIFSFRTVRVHHEDFEKVSKAGYLKEAVQEAEKDENDIGHDVGYFASLSKQSGGAADAHEDCTLKPRKSTTWSHKLHAPRWLRVAIGPWKPYTKGVLLWYLLIMIWDANYTAFLMPLGTAYIDSVLVWNWVTIIDSIAGFLFLFDMLVNLNTGFFVQFKSRKTLVMQRWRICMYYLLHDTMVVDAIATAANLYQFIFLLVGPCSPCAADRANIWLSILRLARLWRIFGLWRKIWAYVGMFANRGTSYLFEYINVISLLNLTYTFCLLLNFGACLWIWTAFEVGTASSWMASSPLGDLSAGPGPSQYLTSLYFVSTTFSTVGYGDISGSTKLELVVTIILQITGVLLFASVIGNFAAAISQTRAVERRMAEYQKQMQQTDAWLHMRKIPGATCKKIHTYFTYLWQSEDDIMDVEQLSRLPAPLRAEVTVCMLSTVLDGEVGNFFASLEPKERNFLAIHAHPQLVRVGETLCQEGDTADCIYVLLEGRLLGMHLEQTMAVYEAPMVLGESVLLQEIPECRFRHLTLLADVNCLVWSLTLDDMERAFLIFPTLRQRLYSTLKASMLRHMQLLQVNDPVWTRMVKLLEASVAADQQRHRQRMAAARKEKKAARKKTPTGTATTGGSGEDLRSGSSWSGKMRNKLGVWRTHSESEGAGGEEGGKEGGEGEEGGGGEAVQDAGQSDGTVMQTIGKALSAPVKPFAQGLASLGSGVVAASAAAASAVSVVDRSVKTEGDEGYDDDSSSDDGHDDAPQVHPSAVNMAALRFLAVLKANTLRNINNDTNPNNDNNENNNTSNNDKNNPPSSGLFPHASTQADSSMPRAASEPNSQSSLTGSTPFMQIMTSGGSGSGHGGSGLGGAGSGGGGGDVEQGGMGLAGHQPLHTPFAEQGEGMPSTQALQALQAQQGEEKAGISKQEAQTFLEHLALDVIPEGSSLDREAVVAQLAEQISETTKALAVKKKGL